MHLRLQLGTVDEKFSFLTNDMKYAAREKVNKETGTKRMYSHAIVTPGRDGWLDKVEEEEAAAEARFLEGLHDRRQHQQAPLQMAVAAR
jgi:hypothetical protein